mmetsp:Transcript_5911/g.12090  ORF Transcript_5911/g.12090 Transcript_5911/m.12090 type:complete len:87 (+) Transcript_5911:177-437(+)
MWEAGFAEPDGQGMPELQEIAERWQPQSRLLREVASRFDSCLTVSLRARVAAVIEHMDMLLSCEALPPSSKRSKPKRKTPKVANRR